MNIKNYTSEVSSEKSIFEIENILIKMGATAISKEYESGKVSHISFAVIKDGVKVPFRLPARVDSVKKLFLKSLKSTPPTPRQKINAEKQAERTAWRNMRDWVHLQHTMIVLDQVEFMEAFMPYIFSMGQGKTAYQLMKDQNYKALLS
jgi:hypothetical protein